MKKTLVILLSLAMAVCMISTVAFAEEGNFITDQTWVKNLCAGEVTKKTEDGVDYWSATGIKAPYSTPGIDILPALKAALGEEDEIDINLKFEVRATGITEDFKMGTLIRGNLKNPELPAEEFNTDYEGDFMKYSSASNINYRLNQNEMGHSDWTEYEYDFTVTSDDVNYEGWKTWMLCVDRIDEEALPSITTLEFRNVSLRNDGGVPSSGGDTGAKATEKPTATEAPSKSVATPTPLPINEPFNFDKYGVTFTKTEQHPMENAVSASNGTNGTVSGNTMLYVIIGAAAVVVLGGGTAVCLAAKNKKKKTDNAQGGETK